MLIQSADPQLKFRLLFEGGGGTMTGTGTGTITGTGGGTITGTGGGTITGTGGGTVTGGGTMTGGCRNAISNCADYGNQMCMGQYEQWARQNCASYCGLCGKTITIIIINRYFTVSVSLSLSLCVSLCVSLSVFLSLKHVLCFTSAYTETPETHKFNMVWYCGYC